MKNYRLCYTSYNIVFNTTRTSITSSFATLRAAYVDNNKKIFKKSNNKEIK